LIKFLSLEVTQYKFSFYIVDTLIFSSKNPIIPNLKRHFLEKKEAEPALNEKRLTQPFI
jgi:hypothetical protein